MKIFIVFFSICLSISWLLPNHYSPWVAAYQDFAVFSAGIILLIGTSIFQKENALPRFIIFLFLIAFIPITQYAFGIVYFSGDALINSLYLISFFISIFIAYNLSNQNYKNTFIIWLASSIIIASLLSSYIALYQWTLQNSTIWMTDLRPGGRPFANFGQPNNLATLIGMGLAATLFFYEKHYLNRSSCTLIALTLLFTLALTQSRSAWLMSLAFLVFWLWKSKTCKTRLRALPAALWVVVYALWVGTLPYIAKFLDLSASSAAERSQALERWDLYTQFYHAILQGPLWGYGWGQVSVAQVLITPDYPVSLFTEYTHNILLDLMIWNGPILGFLIILFTTLWLMKLAWNVRTPEGVFSILAAGFILTHSMLEFPHAYAFFLIPLGLLLGIAQSEAPTKAWNIPNWSIKLIGFFSIIIIIIIWKEYRVLEEDYRLMRFETARIGDLKADQPAPDVLLLTQLQALTRHARTPAKENMSFIELEELSILSKRFANVGSVYRYAFALILNQRYDEAYKQLSILNSLHGNKWLIEAISELRMLEKNNNLELENLIYNLESLALNNNSTREP